MLSNDPSSLSILQLSADEILADTQNLELHTDYAAMWAQEVKQGTISLLVAFSDTNEFLGRLAIVWRKPDEPEIDQYLPGVPTIMAAYVSESKRSHGIGTQLMLAAEKVVLGRDKTQLALGVAANNTRAFSLYEKLGYKKWPHGDISISWTEHRASGDVVIKETCHVMVKDIKGEGYEKV